MSTTVRVTFSAEEYAALRILSAKRRMSVPNMVAADTVARLVSPDGVRSGGSEQARLKKVFGDA